MCNDCFNKEILAFDSEQEFIDFETELSKKLVNSNTMQWLDEPNLIEGFRCDGPYQCFTCNTKWIVSSPDYSSRGYLICNALEGKIFDIRTKQVETEGFTSRYVLSSKSKLKVHQGKLEIFRTGFSFHAFLEPIKLPITIPGRKFIFNNCKEDVFGNIVIKGKNIGVEFELTISPSISFAHWNFYKENILKYIDGKIKLNK